MAFVLHEPKVMKLLSSLLSILFILGCQSSFSAKQEKSSVKNIDTEGSWRPGSKDGFMAIRANAPHWWDYFKKNSSKYFHEEWLTNGTVIGDTHMLNFGTILHQNKYILKPIDLDDSGVGSLLSDIARYVTSEKMNSLGLETTNILKYYKMGLNRTPITYPSWLLQVLDTPRNQIEIEKAKYLQKRMTSQNRLNHKSLETKTIESLTESLKASWSEIANQISIHLSDHKIIDVGYRTKTTGGISGMSRFLVLTESNGDLYLLEVKQISPPAVRLWTEQPPLIERYESLRQALGISPVMMAVESKIDGKFYVVRQKNNEPIEEILEKQNKDKNLYQEWSQIVAYKIGELHGKNSVRTGYANTFNTNEQAIGEAIERYSNQYLKDVGLLKAKP